MITELRLQELVGEEASGWTFYKAGRDKNIQARMKNGEENKRIGLLSNVLAQSEETVRRWIQDALEAD